MPRKSSAAPPRLQGRTGRRIAAPEVSSRNRNLTTQAVRQIEAQVAIASADLMLSPEHSREERSLLKALSRLKTEREKIEFIQVTRLGFYTPRLSTGEPIRADHFDYEDLTRNQKYRFRRAAGKARKAMDDANFALLPAKMDRERLTLLRQQTRDAGGIVTKRAVFLPIEPGERKRVARGPEALSFMPAANSFVITQKWRSSTGELHEERRFLAGATYVADRVGALEKVWKRQKFDPKRQQIRFLARGKYLSAASFGDLGTLLRHLQGYSPELTAKILDSLKIVIVTRGTPPRGGVPIREIDVATGKSRRASRATVRRIADAEVKRQVKRRKRRRNRRGTTT